MSSSGWPRGRTGWMVGGIVILVLGGIVGSAWGNIWVGILLGLLVSLGWMIAYESWRGRNVGIYNREDDGAQL